jgi:propanediol dehydratase small subunit
MDGGLTMGEPRFGIDDYPLAETHPDEVRGRRGRSLTDIDLEAVLEGSITMEDLTITPQALRWQADIARAAGRETLAANFERAAELVTVPQDEIMQIYELLRPGRASSPEPLLDAARRLRETYGAERMAAFVEEAAVVYQRRGLFTYRY